jgi:hypothetical protein
MREYIERELAQGSEAATNEAQYLEGVPTSKK